MTAIINKLMAQGIPVFTAGVTSRGHEFTNFTQIPEKEGETAAEVVLKWMKDTGHDLKVFAVSGGDPAQFWAQGRMKGFREGIQEAIPDAKFVTTEANGLKRQLRSGQDLRRLQGVPVGAPGGAVHPERRHRRRARRPRDQRASTASARRSPSAGTSARASSTRIDKGIQVALFDQRWPDQAAFGGPACAQFLKNGVILPNTQTLMPVTKDEHRRGRAPPTRSASSGRTKARIRRRRMIPRRPSPPTCRPAHPMSSSIATRRSAAERCRPRLPAPAARPSTSALRLGGLFAAPSSSVAVAVPRRQRRTSLNTDVIVSVLRSMSSVAIMALGLTLVIVVGEIDLSFGAMYGLGANALAVMWIMRRRAGLSRAPARAADRRSRSACSTASW